MVLGWDSLQGRELHSKVIAVIIFSQEEAWLFM